MNLQEFINFRERCPFCHLPLINKFISSRKQKIRFENDRLMIIIPIKGLRPTDPDYEAGYSFSLKDNSFAIEFYCEEDRYERISRYMRETFKEFHKNLSATKFRFIRACGFCFKYEVNSNIVDIDLKKSQYSSLNVYNESFLFTNKTSDDYKFILLNNRTEDAGSASDLCWWKSSTDHRIEYTIPANANVKNDLQLIKFVSKEETAARLNNLIIFS